MVVITYVIYTPIALSYFDVYTSCLAVGHEAVYKAYGNTHLWDNFKWNVESKK